MNDIYLEIIEPNKIITNFETIEDFEEWLELGTKEDLLATLKAFEEAELYEYCQIILNRVKMHDLLKNATSNSNIN